MQKEYATSDTIGNLVTGRKIPGATLKGYGQPIMSGSVNKIGTEWRQGEALAQPLHELSS